MARQREFQLQLQQARRRGRGAIPSPPPKPEDGVKEKGSVRRPVTNEEAAAPKNATRDGLVARSATATVTAEGNGVARAVAADTAGKRHKKNRHAAATATAAASATTTTAARDSTGGATTAAVGEKAHRRSRSRWSAAVKLLVTPLSATMPPNPTRSPSHPSLVLTTEPGTADAAKDGTTSLLSSRPAGATDGSDATATARAGSLTVQEVSTAASVLWCLLLLMLQSSSSKNMIWRENCRRLLSKRRF